MASKHNAATSQYLHDLRGLEADVRVVAEELGVSWDIAYKLMLLSWVRAQPTQTLP
ncbi:hypothetical protein LCGC14_2328060, partial [marine sediment metagenome]